MSREGWRRAYREAPDVLDAFARAEDPDGRIAARLVALGALRDARVLEIGAGTGRLAARLAPHCGSYTGLEPADPLRALATRHLEGIPRARLVKAGAQALPFPDGAFDAAVAAWVFAHLPAALRDTAVAEARRVAGRLLLVESGTGGEFQELRRLSGADPDEELARLTQAGFVVLERIETAIVFDDVATARYTIGFLCGDGAARELTARPRARIGHDVLLLGA